MNTGQWKATAPPPFISVMKMKPPKRVTRIFVGEDRVYAAGVKVTYQIDTGYSLERTVPDREDAIAAAPDAALEGYTFVGWRQDDSAEKKVLSEFIITSGGTRHALCGV